MEFDPVVDSISQSLIQSLSEHVKFPDIEELVFNASKQMVQTILIPKLNEILNSHEITDLKSKIAQLTKANDQLQGKLETMEGLAEKLAGISLAQKSKIESLMFDLNSVSRTVSSALTVSSPSYKQRIAEGKFHEAVAMVLQSPHKETLEEFLITESPHIVIEQIKETALKQVLLNRIALTFKAEPHANNDLEFCLKKLEWLTEIMISSRNLELFEAGEILSEFTPSDIKLAHKVGQCLRLLRSMQW
jgi:hypothetical protein